VFRWCTDSIGDGDEFWYKTMRDPDRQGDPEGTALVKPLGDGRHKLPIKAALQKAIAKKPGDRVTVVLQERLDREGD
jgi:hypothetical protein